MTKPKLKYKYHPIDQGVAVASLSNLSRIEFTLAFYADEDIQDAAKRYGDLGYKVTLTDRTFTIDWSQS